MASASRKKSNPFPQDPVAADSVERLADFRDTQCYHDAQQKLEIYREGFFRPLPGMAMGIRGEYGSGKTHLVLQLIEHFNEANSPQFKTIYSKAEFTDVRDFYIKQFARKIEYDDLRDVFAMHVAKRMRMKGSAESSTGPKTLTQIAIDEVRTLLLDNPQGVLNLLEEDLLPGGNLSDEVNAEVKGSAKGVATDFFRAYAKLIDPILARIALRWIQGEVLTIGEMKDIGLQTNSISSPDDAREALRFLLAAFKRADYGIMFCLEEFERPVLRGTVVEKQASFGLLKDLAEIFKGTGHALIVSGVSEAWDNLPSDVLDRIKRTDTIQVSFTEPEARGVLNAYALTVNQSVDEMFGPEALSLLFDVSKLNARRLLSLSHHAYEAADGKIAKEHVEKATNRVLSDPTRLDNLEKKIESIAISQGLTVGRRGELDGSLYDFLLGDLEDPFMVIEIKKSIFKLGEIEAARTIAASSEVLKRNHPRTRLCVVVVGYSTIEVREHLSKVVDRVFYYDEEKFQTEFEGFLKSVAESTVQVKERDVQEKDYRILDQRLDELQKNRQAELEQIKAALEALQKETSRKYEETSEKRRTDKLVEALSDFQSLLRKEEELGVSLMGRGSQNAQQKFELALRLLDDQRAELATIAILNEKLPEANKFAEQLYTLRHFTRMAEGLWSRADERRKEDETSDFFLDNYFEPSGVRQFYRERKDTLNVLEAMHDSRMNTDSRNIVAMIVRGIRKLSLPMLSAWILAVIGVVFVLGLFGSSLIRESASKAEHLTVISSIQLDASQIAIDSTLQGTDRGHTVGQNLVQNVSRLDALASLTGLSASDNTYMFEKYENIRRLAQGIRKEISRSPDSTYSTGYQSAAQEIVENCYRIRLRINNSSFYQFVVGFLRFNLVPFAVALVPLIVVVALTLVRRHQRSRSRKRLYDWSIPEISQLEPTP